LPRRLRAARPTTVTEDGSGTAVTPESAAEEPEIPLADGNGVPWMPMFESMMV